MRKLSLLPLLTILTYSLGVELCSGIWLPSSACLRPGVIHPQRPQCPPSCRSKEKEVHFRRSDNMCIYLYQKYKHRNPNTNTEGDPATRLRWLLAGLGPEGSAGRDVQGRARCRRGSPRHVGHKGALSSLGHHELQDTGNHHFMEWRRAVADSRASKDFGSHRRWASL